MTVNYAAPSSAIPFSEEARHFLVIAIAAGSRLGWRIGQVHAKGFTALLPVYEEGMPYKYARLLINSQSADIYIETNDAETAAAMYNDTDLESFARTVEEIKYYYTAEELELRYLQLEAAFAPPAPVVPEKEERFGFFGKAKDYIVTRTIVAVNILIFFALVLSGMDIIDGNGGMMVRWGANFGPLTLEGQWWRLLTACFLHFGFLHMAMNMYVLVYAGLLLEPYLGRQRFAAAYLLTGVVASVTSLWWHPYVVSAGASGAVFGIYGVLLAMLTTNVIAKKVRKPMLMSIAFYVIYNLGAGLKDGVDNAAHIGGLLSGMMIGYVYAWGLKRPATQRVRHLSIVLLTILALGITAIIYMRTPNVMKIYDSEMKHFSRNEQHSLTLYNLPANTTAQQQMQAIQQDGIHYWKENVDIVARLDNMKLPDELHDRNKLLLTYCALRLEYFDLKYRSLKEHTAEYQPRIDVLDKQIEEQLLRLAEQ